MVRVSIYIDKKTANRFFYRIKTKPIEQVARDLRIDLKDNIN